MGLTSMAPAPVSTLSLSFDCAGAGPVCTSNNPSTPSSTISFDNLALSRAFLSSSVFDTFFFGGIMLAKKFLSLLKFKGYRSQNKGQSQVIKAGTLLTALNALQFEAFYSQNFSSQL
jgi:hypothetical protein